jgi:hypothetical protein
MSSSSWYVLGNAPVAMQVHASVKQPIDQNLVEIASGVQSIFRSFNSWDVMDMSFVKLPKDLEIHPLNLGELGEHLDQLGE